jgi:hypothetical protein
MTIRYARIAVVAVTAALPVAACGPRLNVITGTTVGLKASPGDGSTTPPQVTLAYKRAEGALVPTAGNSSTKDTSDTYSALTAYFLKTSWFGATTLESVISTGHAARNLAKPSSAFQQEFAAATLKEVDAAVQKRREALAQDPAAADEEKAQRILDLAGYAKRPGMNAVQSLKSVILDAQTDGEVARLEAVFFQVQHSS